MITGISIVSVWVLDQEPAKEFYADKLGFTVTNDIKMDNGMRWLTVRPPGSESQELGVEALMRDDSGNWFSFTQRRGGA